MNFGALSRGFGTCCLRFKNGVTAIPAKLASGWLARLYREGVEPSGSLQKVSDHIPILLFWICPGAREVSIEPNLLFHIIRSLRRHARAASRAECLARNLRGSNSGSGLLSGAEHELGARI